MSGTQRRRDLASYRDTVAEQMNAGEAFDEVEDSAAGRASPPRIPHLAMGDSQMNGRGRQRDWGDALAVIVNEQTGRERYRRRQLEVRRGRTETQDRPRPLEFDESGFPIAQSTPSFVTRVARLLGQS